MILRVRILEWELTQHDPPIWVGQLKQPISCVCFEIVGAEEDKFQVNSNLKGVRTLVIRGLDNAKKHAQQQFEHYVKPLHLTE